MERKKLKQWAKNAFHRSYWKGVLVSLIFYVVVFATIFLISYGLSLILVYVLPSLIASLVYSAEGYGQDARIAFSITAIFLMIFVVIGGAMMLAGIGAKTFAGNHLEIGCKKFFIKSLYFQGASLGEMGAGFKKNYKNAAWVMFVRDLYLGLWSLLCTAMYMFVGTVVLYAGMSMLGFPYCTMTEFEAFLWMMALTLVVMLICIASFIPMYIKLLQYLFVPYIIAENPDMPRKQVFDLSKQMIYGDKWNVCVMHMSFSGWFILSALTCYILHIFYVGPYFEYTTAAYYEAMKTKLDYRRNY